MPNVSAKMEGNLLTLTIDVSKEARKAAQPSKSGLAKAKEKGLPESTVNRLIASTDGFMNVGDDIKVSLNATIPPV